MRGWILAPGAIALAVLGCAAEAPHLPAGTIGSSGPTSVGDTSATAASADVTAGSDDARTTGATGGETGVGPPDTGATAGDSTGEPPPPPVGECVGLPIDCDAPSVAPGNGECNLWAQDCPPGSKCVPVIGDPGDSACVLVAAGAGQLGDPCISEHGGFVPSDSCDVGLLCAGGNPQSSPVCTALCGCSPDTPSCPEPEHLCVFEDEGSWGLCQPPCNPLIGDCPLGEGCFPLEDSPEFACSASESPFSDPYDGCGGPTDCAAGMLCVPGVAIGCVDPDCCAEVCDVTDPGEPCGVGGFCHAWFEDPTVPETCEADVGFCEYD